MFHARIWGAIDKVAARYKMSCSGLARRSGLDPTVFNKSKRYTSTGKPHYPSMYSIAKVLASTGITMSEFAKLMSDDEE